MNTKRHLMRVILLIVVTMQSSSIPVMAQNSEQDKLLEAAVEQNEDFRRGVELASGKTPKYKEAIPFFEKAANSGLPIAMVMVGICYYQLDDLQKTVMWYTKAAEQGYAEAQFKLGLCYEFSKGVEEDLQKAVMWYTKAAEHVVRNRQFQNIYQERK